NVLVAPHGALLDGNGVDAETLAAKVAYMARLTDLVGQAMGAGETRAVKVRTGGTELLVKRHADGHVSASLGPVDPSADAPPSPSSPVPPSVKFT
ncbi:MAG TPA: hypothetical protein VMG12_22050, partial [Polyangiaceae bacterium]|nr:hypothetical protein [Polyangiaceae bacterium]